MARKPRIHYPGALYHVMLRGNGGGEIFAEDHNRQYVETLVAEGVARFGHRIHAYCWMSNNVHLAIEGANTPLSKIIQNLSDSSPQTTADEDPLTNGSWPQGCLKPGQRSVNLGFLPEEGEQSGGAAGRTTWIDRPAH